MLFKFFSIWFKVSEFTVRVSRLDKDSSIAILTDESSKILAV